MVRVVGVVAVLLGAVAALVVFLRNDAPDPEEPPHEAPAREEAPAAPGEPRSAPVLEGTRAPTHATAPAAHPAQEAKTTYHAKVLTVAGEPAAGVTVEARLDRTVLASVTTDAAGSFRFQLVDAVSPAEQLGTVRARAADGSVAQAMLVLALRSGADPRAAGPAPGTPRDLGTLQLAPSHTIEVRVAGTCRAGQPATLWLLPATAGFATPWSVEQTDAEGRATIEGLPVGTWMIVAWAPGCGRARVPLELPRQATDPLEIALGEPRTLEVLVRDAADKTPIVGAVVRAQEQVSLPGYITYAPLHSCPAELTTDAEGFARIEGLSGAETLTLRARAQDYPTSSTMRRGLGGGGPGEVRSEPGQTDALIELKKPITVRWPLKDEGVGIPPDGTEVKLEPWTNTGRLEVPPRGVIEGRELVVPGWGSDGASGYAVLAGFGAARLQAMPGETKGHPTAFYPLRKIELIAKHADGQPAEGWFLIVRDGGNNPVKPGVRTDAEGRATMDGLYGGAGSLVDVSVSTGEGHGGFALALGSVNLYERDGRFDAVIPAERTLRIRLTLQGAPLPANLAAWPTLNHARVSAPLPEQGITEPGVFEARWRPHLPDAVAVVSAQSAGLLAETKQVPPSVVESGAEVVIDLRPAGSVHVQVKEPEDKRYRVALDRLDPSTGGWSGSESPFAFGSSRGLRANANGVVELQGLVPGRYRAIDTTSGLTSEPFDVQAGGTPTRIAFDLSTTGWAKGRVVLPADGSFEGVTVGEHDAKPAGPFTVVLAGHATLPGTPVNPQDGTFWFRLPGTRPVTLRAFHPTLRPHATLGQVTVTKAQEGLELHMERGATARLRFTRPAPVFMNRGQARPIPVRLYAGPVEGAGKSLAATLDGAHQNVEFGGFEPGTFTVWIDAPGSAPVVLEGVVFGSTDVDLGEVALSSGASLELQVSVKDGQSPPRFSVWAESLDEPTYVRNVDAAGSKITLEGLGAGRFRVHATPYNHAVRGLQEEIVFDGRSKVVRVIDAR
jgi:hypothetical protein